jgi:hypothetical protein
MPVRRGEDKRALGGNRRQLMCLRPFVQLCSPGRGVTGRGRRRRRKGQGRRRGREEAEGEAAG